MKNKILSLLASSSIIVSAFGGAIDFDMKDPKGVNNIVFLLDAPLESINGTATGISGNVSFDPAAPSKTSGKIVVAVNSLTVANPKMVEHIMGDMWLAESAHPEIVFTLSSLADVKQDGKKINATAHGTLTIKGTSKAIAVPVSLTYLEGMLQQRQRIAGDLLVVRSNFSVKRSDFGINSGKMEDKVSDEIELRLSLAGVAPKES